ncbi:ABC transporter permease [Cellulomonas fimi]|uniref:Binding-protein-dependent transport systems inner membrane component n=1 Tax=Cellulomonas fimi (strain ATCC 484 / DSM 20113 / JCM 1341 / CCUG 24087 / LMG 16345 / NBRC 15513 / NCIMB 8980 / NCTC 7547 / NRS-133) TaxID=590998 RepID=F4H3J9_CELFA|nr:ABC transporter permease [Cellulomonas fimi]AEE46544.1 binding-protein-dependent transport systems inner membrane component [Cellulomonas fimi ATCC 484]NNH09161.1 ABC transporter permease [Cellulomonas fimi]VEH33423.1 Probable D,D-dipeptide transport system permease protein ddpC [Cellulomonas fimi]
MSSLDSLTGAQTRRPDGFVPTALDPDARADDFTTTAAERFADAVRAHDDELTHRGPWRTRLEDLGRRPGLVLALLWSLAVLVAAFVPTLLAPGDPLSGVPADKLQPPSGAHWFGTDQLGRDLYTRVVHGTQLTLQAALVAVLVGLVVGALIGLVAGFVGGLVDDVAMRVVDVLLSIPALLLSLALITVLGFGSVNVAIAVGLANVASVSRIMRSEVLRVRTSGYVEAAQAGGSPWWTVLLGHVLPNSVGPVVVLAALELGAAVLAVSSLSFLGYGEPPPAPEWGALVAGGRDHLRTSWWLTTLPGLVIVATVLAAGRVSRALDGDPGRNR